jgi:hypothetical protein
MNIFFLLSSKHEIFEAKFILANINHSNHKVFLLIENSKRNQNLDLNFDGAINIVLLPQIYPSKRIFLNFKKRNQIIKALNELPVSEIDKFFFFHNSSLLFFITTIFFENFNIKKVMFLTSNFYIENKDSSFKLLETLFINILCFPIIKRLVFIKYYKKTFFKNTYIKDRIDFIISLKNLSKVNNIRVFNIKSFFKTPKKLFISKQKIIILIVEQWLVKFPNYKKAIFSLIELHGIRNILLKDHPLSNLTDIELMNIFQIDKSQIIPKNESFEEYIYKNINQLKLVYGPTSAALKYASFIGLKAICYQNMFNSEKNYYDYTLDYFKFHKDIELIKELNGSSFVFIKKTEENLNEIELDDALKVIL